MKTKNFNRVAVARNWLPLVEEVFGGSGVAAARWLGYSDGAANTFMKQGTVPHAVDLACQYRLKVARGELIKAREVEKRVEKARDDILEELCETAGGAPMTLAFVKDDYIEAVKAVMLADEISPALWGQAPDGAHSAYVFTTPLPQTLEALLDALPGCWRMQAEAPG